MEMPIWAMLICEEKIIGVLQFWIKKEDRKKWNQDITSQEKEKERW